MSKQVSLNEHLQGDEVEGHDMRLEELMTDKTLDEEAKSVFRGLWPIEFSGHVLLVPISEGNLCGNVGDSRQCAGPTTAFRSFGLVKPDAGSLEHRLAKIDTRGHAAVDKNSDGGSRLTAPNATMTWSPVSQNGTITEPAERFFGRLALFG